MLIQDFSLSNVRHTTRRDQGLLGEIVMNLSRRKLAHILRQPVDFNAMLSYNAQILAKQSHHSCRGHKNNMANLLFSRQPSRFFYDFLGKASIRFPIMLRAMVIIAMCRTSVGGASPSRFRVCIQLTFRHDLSWVKESPAFNQPWAGLDFWERCRFKKEKARILSTSDHDTVIDHDTPP
jgi:hypothetical protein